MTVAGSNYPEMITVQVWTEKLLPLLAAHIAETGDVVASHTVISHGAMVANLLEASSALPHRTKGSSMAGSRQLAMS